MADTPERMSVDMTVADGETLVRVSGTRDVAVIVRSPSGEEVYLPPEEFDEEPGDGPSHDSHYQSGSPDQSPYEGAAPDDSPYAAAEGNSGQGRHDAEGIDTGQRPVGVETTASGFHVYHPEPATDMRIVTG